ncbi:MAG: CDP-diacylglycerol--glycerol-3-phosphate 3-phosphatidyltransferase [Pseudomonadota bacterium]
MLNIPNILTLARIGLLPIIAYWMYLDMPLCALILYIICALTDFFDGWLARKLNAVSDFGTFFDHIADKIFVAALLLVMVDLGTLGGLWLIPIAIIISREFFISGLREFLGPKNVKLPASMTAKWKTTVQMIALALLIAAPLSGHILLAGHITLLIASALTVISGWSYAREGFKHMG